MPDKIKKRKEKDFQVTTNPVKNSLLFVSVGDIIKALTSYGGWYDPITAVLEATPPKLQIRNAGL